MLMDSYVMDALNQYPKPILRGTVINVELAKLATKIILRHCMELSWKTTNQRAVNNTSDQSGKWEDGVLKSNVTRCDDVNNITCASTTKIMVLVVSMCVAPIIIRQNISPKRVVTHTILDNCNRKMFIFEDLVHALKIVCIYTSLVPCNSLDNCCFGIISLLIAATKFF